MIYSGEEYRMIRDGISLSDKACLARVESLPSDISSRVPKNIYERNKTYIASLERDQFIHV